LPITGALTDLIRKADDDNRKEEDDQSQVRDNEEEEEVVGAADILSSETITVKKSTFQGHGAVVFTLDDVKKVLKKLKQNKKVSQATHNIVAYRLAGVKENTYIQDYADDGEIHAGGRLMHLLQIMDVKNVVIVVSRWYGGILLGPDRFRLINNVAREAVLALGIYEPKQTAKHSKLKKRKH